MNFNYYLKTYFNIINIFCLFLIRFIIFKIILFKKEEKYSSYLLNKKLKNNNVN